MLRVKRICFRKTLYISAIASAIILAFTGCGQDSVQSPVIANYLKGKDANTSSLSANEQINSMTPKNSMADGYLRMPQQIEQNIRKITKEQALPSFSIQKGDGAESIFNKLTLLTGSIYYVTGESFTSPISIPDIKSEEELKTSLNILGYSYKSSPSAKLIKIEIFKDNVKSRKALANVGFSAHGTLQPSMLVSDICLEANVNFNLEDKTTADVLNMPINANFTGNGLDAIDYILSSAGEYAEYGENSVNIKYFKTALLDFILPDMDVNLVANIINQSSSSTSGSGSTGQTGTSSGASSGQASGAQSSSTSGAGTSTAAMNLYYGPSIVKELKVALESGLSKYGTATYSASNGQISVRDKFQNVEYLTKIVNGFNDKYKEYIDVELKMYRVTTNNSTDYGLDLTSLIRGTFSMSASGFVAAAMPSTGPNFQGAYKNGAQNATLQLLATYGHAEEIWSITLDNTNNVLNVKKIATNQGYISALQSTPVAYGTTNTNQISTTAASATSGSFVSALAKTLNGNQIAVNYYTSLQELNALINHDYAGGSIQTPNTSEQSDHNIKFLQNGVPYVLSAYSLSVLNNSNNGLPFLEQTFVDKILGSHQNDLNHTYIVVVMTAKKRI